MLKFGDIPNNVCFRIVVETSWNVGNNILWHLQSSGPIDDWSTQSYSQAKHKISIYIILLKWWKFRNEDGFQFITNCMKEWFSCNNVSPHKYLKSWAVLQANKITRIRQVYLWMGLLQPRSKIRNILSFIMEWRLFKNNYNKFSSIIILQLITFSSSTMSWMRVFPVAFM